MYVLILKGLNGDMFERLNLNLLSMMMRMIVVVSHDDEDDCGSLP